MNSRFIILAILGIAVNIVCATTFSYTPSAKRSDPLNAANPAVLANNILRSQVRQGSTKKRQPDTSSQKADSVEDQILREDIRKAVAKRRSNTMGSANKDAAMKKRALQDRSQEDSSRTKRAVRFSA